jgi:hypothetical protein
MICHPYKCIFIHVPKAAGQSVENYFLKKLGLDWHSRSPLLLRNNTEPKVGPPKLAHLKAVEYVKYFYLSQEIFDAYFKFGFVRNPWSRTVSIYKYMGYSSVIDFETFVNYQLPQLMKTANWFVCPQYEFFYDKDKLLLDFVGKFETIEKDFKTICEKLGFADTTLPHVNKSEKEKFKSIKMIAKDPSLLSKISLKKPFLNNYKEYYTETSKNNIHKMYEKDVDIFEYDF